MSVLFVMNLLKIIPNREPTLITHVSLEAKMDHLVPVPVVVTLLWLRTHKERTSVSNANLDMSFRLFGMIVPVTVYLKEPPITP